MDTLQAIILGIIQGFTEFLPISSSAHLYLVPYFFGWDYQGLGFDVALHWGTLAAVLWVFWRDYLNALRDRQLFIFLVIGSIPAAAAGILLEKQAETVFRHPLVSVFTLAGFAVLLWVADMGDREDKGFDSLNWMRAFFIGIAQALAIVPGVSRSGATITAGLFSGMSRTAAARFSFLLSGPIIFGAGLVELKSLESLTIALAFGFIAAAISSLLAIKFLLKYLSTHDFKIFIIYRFILAAIVLLIILNRV